MEQEKFKIILFKTISAFFVVLTLAVVYCIFFGPLKKYADSLTPSKTITVSAEGKVTASPDIAQLSFSVVSEGMNPEKIADDNNKKISAAIEFVKLNGVELEDVKTTNYNLNPRYEYDEDKRTSYISGYVLTQTVSVKIRDLGGVAKILGGLPSVGINQIFSVGFSIDDPENIWPRRESKLLKKPVKKPRQWPFKTKPR